MQSPSQLADLVKRFQDNLDAYLTPHYNEANVRAAFIDPFFRLLGWDVQNEDGHAEQYKDVVYEDAVKVGGSTKAPDYSFRIGGARKFFVEAKKPSVDIKSDAGAAFQLRRYAWSAKLPLSVLTNFRAFAVYDCRLRPSSADEASTGRLLYIPFLQYADRWGEIASLLSKEAVLKGAFDRFAVKQRRGTAEVDSAFLAEIERWRSALARNIALRNWPISEYDLNFAIQMTIDRVIFLRICEDRGIENYGQLRALCSGTQVYKRLAEAFRRADQRYNSGLFHFDPEHGRSETPDRLTLKLHIDDELLKDIIGNLYYPDSPYEFSVLPADILGQVYEQFLGKVVRLSGQRVHIDAKPEVKKAGGVFYTPAFVVRYIVEQTLARLLAGRAPRDISRLKVLDPACGSGSFLLGAYDSLLSWYRDWYVAADPGRHKKQLYLGPGGQWRLTTTERRRILLSHIFGVDIDSQAVEVTKLSLLLKVLEGETADTLNAQLKLFLERALPDLSSNIKCGNSLVGGEFYKDKQLDLLHTQELRRVNAFDWDDQFPDAMKSGGFDVVIGNPPYVLLQDEFRDDAQLKYFRSSYAVASYKIDTYHLFIERALRLCRQGGRCSLIVPANFLTNNHLKALRQLLMQSAAIDHVLVVDQGVFPGISVDNAIFVTTGGRATGETFEIRHATAGLGGFTLSRRIAVSTPSVLREEHSLYSGDILSGLAPAWKKLLSKSVPLGSMADVNFGKQLRDRRTHARDVINIPGIRSLPRGYVACYTGRDVLRYALNWGKLACWNNNAAQRGGCWDSAKHDAKDKIVTRQIGKFPEFAIDRRGYHCLNTMFMINLRDSNASAPYLLGVLNSSTIRAVWLDRFYDRRRTFPKIKGTYLKQLPILDPTKILAGTAQRISELAEHIVRLKIELSESTAGHESAVLQRSIAAAENEVDTLVFEAYDLNDRDRELIRKHIEDS